MVDTATDHDTRYNVGNTATNEFIANDKRLEYNHLVTILYYDDPEAFLAAVVPRFGGDRQHAVLALLEGFQRPSLPEISHTSSSPSSFKQSKHAVAIPSRASTLSHFIMMSSRHLAMLLIGNMGSPFHSFMRLQMSWMHTLPSGPRFKRKDGSFVRFIHSMTKGHVS